MRVGMGFDVHPFAEHRPLVLGGVTIDGAPGLAGHSDADALTHAVSDAVLGAAGLPDLGTLFPAGPETEEGASSVGFLEQIAARLHAEGWCVVNVDAVIAAETPRLAPHLDAMRRTIARALHAARAPGEAAVAVSVKPKRGEGLGAIGRAEGLAAWAVALLERQSDPGAGEGRH
jgi:2-C-methyl-D-erythritol 2,4-cyclodiphosphate synthase